MDLLQAVTAAVLLAGNFFFVAVEFSVTKARPTMVDQLVEDGIAGARALKHGVDNIDNYLSACQLGITICSIGLGVTAEPLLTHAFEGAIPGPVLGNGAATIAFIAGYAVVSSFHVVLGELTPKSLAIARWRRVGLLLLPPMRIFYLATKPVVDAFNWLGNIILRPFGIPPASEAESEPHSEQELQTLIAESERRGLLARGERDFAFGAFTFGDRQARDVMVPRGQVDVVRADQSLRSAARTVGRSGHSRLPVVDPEAGLDEPLGLLTNSELVTALGDEHEVDVTELARPLAEASAATELDELLERLRGERDQIALLSADDGRAVGVITLEDIVEQVVGDLPKDRPAPTDGQ